MAETVFVEARGPKRVTGGVRLKHRISRIAGLPLGVFGWGVLFKSSQMNHFWGILNEGKDLHIFMCGASFTA